MNGSFLCLQATYQPACLPALGCNLEGATKLPDRHQLATNFLSQPNLINCCIKQQKKYIYKYDIKSWLHLLVTAIDQQQQHSCETLICQRHQTILWFLSSAATASTRWRVRQLY